MQNKEGVTIPVFLTSKCNALADMGLELSQVLADRAPSRAEQIDFLRNIALYSEVLPRAYALRDAIALAHFDGKSLPETLQKAIDGIDKALGELDSLPCGYRGDPDGDDGPLTGGLAGLARDALTAFRAELAEFLPHQ